MANLSLQSALRTCKVDTSWSERIESDRFLNPNNMICPVWNGNDNLGRPVPADSFQTKSRGCNSALDRILVENCQRPQYAEYVTLDTSGYTDEMYSNSTSYQNTRNSACSLRAGLNNVGTFGQDFKKNVYPRCSSYAKEQAMSQEAEDQRASQRSHYRCKDSGQKAGMY